MPRQGSSAAIAWAGRRAPPSPSSWPCTKSNNNDNNDSTNNNRVYIK